MADFHLIDLRSQAAAVRAALAGLPEEAKLAWLAARGELLRAEPSAGGPFYLFRSTAGLACVFLIKGGELVFIVDQSTEVTRPA